MNPRALLTRLKRAAATPVPETGGTLVAVDRAAESRQNILLAKVPPALPSPPEQIGSSLQVECRDCRHLDWRSTAQPDGWCRNLDVETWTAVPFTCAQFKPAREREQHSLVTRFEPTEAP
jgi:hypothetical protein